MPAEFMPAEFILAPHPTGPGSPITSIGVSAGRPRRDLLILVFVVGGAIERARWPDPAEACFTDALWRHSCFEAFVSGDDDHAYAEINLATSTRWAVYRFDDERTGMRRLAGAATSGSIWQAGSDQAVFGSAVTLGAFADLPTWRLGLAAVIEDNAGDRSYWALRHSRALPDFHARDCFTAVLAAPDPAMRSEA